MNANKKLRQKTLLADKIEPFQFPFDTQAWESFEALRDAKNQQKRAFRGQIGKYLGISIALVGLCFWLFQNKMSQNNANLLSENNFNQKRDPSVYEANLDEKEALNRTESNKRGLFSSLIFSTVPEGRDIYNRRFQSAGTDLLRVPMSRRDNILTLKYSLYETKPIIGDMLPPIEIGGYKYFVPNGTAFLRNINNLDKNQFTNSFNNPLINSDKNELINANKNELIVKKTGKRAPSVSDSFLNKKTLFSMNLAAIKNENVDNFTNEINANLLIKNTKIDVELNALNHKDLSLNNGVKNTSNYAVIDAENNKEFINNHELVPLSIKSFLDSISSNSNTFLPIIPQIKSNPLTKSPKNEVIIGFGKSSIYAGKWKQTVFSAIYLRRITPLMAFGLNTTYSQGSESTNTFSADAQLNFTIFHRPQLGLYLTTGYGYRTWRLPDNYQTGRSKGIALGLDARYSPIKNYFAACRLEMKETSYGNVTFLVQIGKLF